MIVDIHISCLRYLCFLLLLCLRMVVFKTYCVVLCFCFVCFRLAVPYVTGFSGLFLFCLFSSCGTLCYRFL